jgi:KEOPS complex subunit Cgi121
MLIPLETYGKYLVITGFRNVIITDAKAFVESVKGACRDVDIQFFDAELVATCQHLHLAVLNALMAFDTGRNISKSLAVEILLYSSGYRQIRKALELVGIKKGQTNIAGIIVSEKEKSVNHALSVLPKFTGSSPDETVLQLSKSKILCIKKNFDISDKELSIASGKGNSELALVDLVIERVI